MRTLLYYYTNYVYGTSTGTAVRVLLSVNTYNIRVLHDCSVVLLRCYRTSIAPLYEYCNANAVLISISNSLVCAGEALLCFAFGRF